MDVTITDDARRSLIALADGLASDPGRAPRVLKTLVELCRDQSSGGVGSGSTGVAAEHGLDKSVPGGWTVSWMLSADRRALTVTRVGPAERGLSG